MLPRSNAKLPHYLPRSYQSGFAADDGLVSLYDRRERRFDRRHPIRVGAVRDYYTAEGEAYLADLDGRGVAIVRKLDNSEVISIQERESLAAYAACLVTRVPRLLNALNQVKTQLEIEMNRGRFPSPDAVRAAVDASNLSEADKVGFDPELMFEMYQTGDYYAELTQHGRTLSMLDHAAPLLDGFREMRWVVAHANGEPGFITSDFPVVMLRPAESIPVSAPAGYLTPGVRKAFPLTSRTCLYMDETGGGNVHTEFSSVEVRLTNLEVAAQCERYILGPDMPQIEDVVRMTRIDSIPSQPLFRIT